MSVMQVRRIKTVLEIQLKASVVHFMAQFSCYRPEFQA